MIKIRAKKDGFRRAGQAFSSTLTEYSDDQFSPEQIKQLQAEPMIEIQLLPDLPMMHGDALSREDLGKMTVAELRALADDLGLFFEEKMKKSDLVEMILERIEGKGK